MDLEPEELQFLTIPELLHESISIINHSPKTFHLVTLTLIFPLSFSMLAHSLFFHPIIARLASGHWAEIVHDWIGLLVFQFFYVIFLFVFSLLSTAAVVFTVASIYTSRAVSFSSTISAIPLVFKRLFLTFLWISPLMLHFNAFFLVFLAVFRDFIEDGSLRLAAVCLMVVFVFCLWLNADVTALWHVASVVSVVEPVFGLAAIIKSSELLKGKTKMATVLVFVYFAICAVIGWFFRSVVVHGGGIYSIWTRIVAGGLLVCVLAIVNLVGLLVQTVFYYVCKSYHHQGIDKIALQDHLGGYLGEYVPLKSSIQMENLDA